MSGMFGGFNLGQITFHQRQRFQAKLSLILNFEAAIEGNSRAGVKIASPVDIGGEKAMCFLDPPGHFPQLLICTYFGKISRCW